MSADQQQASRGQTTDRAARRRVIMSTYLGTTIEWFDFYIYGLAAGLVFADQFFPTASHGVGTIASFGTLAGGFLARPIGGIIGGHFGDRYGRKKVLVTSMLVMGVSTFLVGSLPTYASIGVWAPALLVAARVAQGLGAGAEWGGGVLMVVEHLDKNRRGFWGSIGNLGVYSGATLATLVFAVITQLPAETQDWVWRVPFLGSAILVVVGLWVRLGVTETPVFQAAERAAASRARTGVPFAEIVRKHRKAVVIAILIATGPTVAYQTYVTFAASYSKTLGGDVSTLLLFQFIIGVMALGLTPLFGWLSDLWGRRPITILGSIAMMPSIYLLLWALNNDMMPLVLVALIVLEIGHSMVYGPFSAFLAELFDTRTRYTGTSLGYQVGGAISGLAPLGAASILAASGGAPHVYAVPIIMISATTLTVVGAALAPEMARRELPT